MKYTLTMTFSSQGVHRGEEQIVKDFPDDHKAYMELQSRAAAQTRYYERVDYTIMGPDGLVSRSIINRPQPWVHRSIF